MKYFAHSSDEDGKPWQALNEHLMNTAKLARKYAEKFGAGELGYLCGILHDIGKYSEKFQLKLHGQSLQVDHSTAGAREVLELFDKKFAKLMAYCIAGHHSGLLDYGTNASTEGTLSARLHYKKIEDYSAYHHEIDVSKCKIINTLPIRPIDPRHLGFTISFFVRMLYSSLVDADFIDTETYFSGELKPRGDYLSIHQLNSLFNKFLGELTVKETKINLKRNEILMRCKDMAKLKRGLYSLTVPTGGGKTYSSFAFALDHANEHQLDRIIYVIPYTSIIEQNARLFKNILGTENVLEHHSNFQFDDMDSENKQSAVSKLKLASENWNIPIVVTTNVQFFESLFANRSSKCRKLHNISKSVIIFDEAQMLPIQYLKPCLLGIVELVQNYGSTAIICTATQPAIHDILPESVRPIEIMPNPSQLYEEFKKVRVIKKDEMTDEEITDALHREQQVLCIVNTRKHAKALFDRIAGENAFHLSSLMCPVHRFEILSEIRKRLDVQNPRPCKVVSTQLIEAGVDVDFPVVFRALAGIDSIVQSAGRCNREGRTQEGKVFVFKPNSYFSKVRGYLDRTAKVAEMVFRKYDDPISLDAIEFYFRMLYDIEGKEFLDRKGILQFFEERGNHLEFNFKSAADEFKLIESNTYAITVPYDENAKDLIQEAMFSPYPASVARKLQPYMVSVYEYEFKELVGKGVIKTINDSFYVLDDFESNYDNHTGIKIEKNRLGEAIFV